MKMQLFVGRRKFFALFPIAFLMWQGALKAQSLRDTAHVSAEDCQCYNIRNTGTYSQGSGVDLRVDAINIEGGRFAVMNTGKAGMDQVSVGVGMMGNPVLANFDVRGTSVIEGPIVFISDRTRYAKWLTIPGSTKDYWAMWLDKGIVATNFAVSSVDKWADYVFEKNYRLMPLTTVDSFINANKHLPGIPSEEVIKQQGYTVQDMNVRFMQKIEELTLYTIELNKELREQKEQIAELETKIGNR